MRSSSRSPLRLPEWSSRKRKRGNDLEADQSGGVAHRRRGRSAKVRPGVDEYQNKGRYRADYPAGMTMRDHNAIVREAMRETVRSGIYCVRSVVR